MKQSFDHLTLPLLTKNLSQQLQIHIVNKMSSSRWRLWAHTPEKHLSAASQNKTT